MPQKIVDIPGIGETILSKRRGSKNLRLTLLPDGRVRVGLPTWLPYSAAIRFAISRSDWIQHNLANRQLPVLKHGDLIGKSYRLLLVYEPSSGKLSAKVGRNLIHVSSHLPPHSGDVQKKIILACERALKRDASKLLAIRIEEIANQSNLTYKNLHIKRLSSRWGSCSHDKSITLSYFLIQLPWHLIDYVIMHELVHTVHLNHSPAFWQTFEGHMPKARALRKEVNLYRPAILPNGLFMA